MTKLEREKARLAGSSGARERVYRLNKQGEAAVKGATEGDAKLAAYKKYVDKFYELKERFPNWEEHLNEPIEYSSFVLDYNEEVYKLIGNAAEDFKGMSPEAVYALKQHGVNLRNVEILREKLGELLPGSEWTKPGYVEAHIRDAYQLLREHYPDDEEYDKIFSPKEEMLLFGD